MGRQVGKQVSKQVAGTQFALIPLPKLKHLQWQSETAVRQVHLSEVRRVQDSKSSCTEGSVDKVSPHLTECSLLGRDSSRQLGSWEHYTVQYRDTSATRPLPPDQYHISDVVISKLWGAYLSSAVVSSQWGVGQRNSHHFISPYVCNPSHIFLLCPQRYFVILPFTYSPVGPEFFICAIWHLNLPVLGISLKTFFFTHYETQCTERIKNIKTM